MSFEDIKGQDPECREESFIRDNPFSSYLFVGPDGAGKLLAAKNFAKALGCPPHHPDFFLVEPSGASASIGIEEIRCVIQKANLKPYEARKKVFIVNDAHSMNEAASNAFLKTLEEPPQDNVFILISRSKDLLLSTIVSRCHIVRFWKAAKIKEMGSAERKKRVIDNLEIGAYPDKEGLKENLDILASFFRDMFLYKAVGGETTFFHTDRIDKIKKECDRFTLDELDYLIKRAITLRSYVDYNVNPKIIADVLTNEIKRKAASRG